MSAELFLWIFVGTAAGIVVGSIPGLTGAMAIALTLPLTFSMEPNSAFALLVAMYVGSVSGGLITAILLNMPGTPASVVTTLDGYPLARKNQARRALGLGVGASLVGGILSWFVLLGLAKPMAALALKLHPFDMLGLILVALALVATVSRGALLAGFLSVSLGILAALPGLDPATGQPRLTFGWESLEGGFRLLPVLIGLFAVGEAVRMAVAKPDRPGRSGKRATTGGRLPGWRVWKSQSLNLIRSSMIGSFVGVLPGIGANIGSLLAYGAAKTVARDRDQFGEGADSGIVASESANNATVGGALVPLIAMGIPGSVIDAILLGAFVIHGLQPGPLLFENSPEVVSTIAWSYLFANVVMFALMGLGAGQIRKLADIPTHLFVPAVLAFCVVGSYALGNRMFDVWVMLGFGAAGLVLGALRIPLAPFILGFVLTPLLEEQLVVGLSMTAGDWTPIFQRPLSATLCALALLLFLGPLLPGLKRITLPQPPSSPSPPS